MADELERALRQRDLELLAQPRNPRGVAPQKAGPLDLGVGLKERLAFLNQTFNPVEAIGQSMGAGERLLSGDVEGYDQLAALGDMLSGVASVLPGVGPFVRGSRTAVKAAKTAKPAETVPGRTAPHGDVDNQRAMMIAGTKPATALNPWEFDDSYKAIADRMGFEVRPYTFADDVDKNVFYVVAQPGEGARADRMVEIIKEANAKGPAGFTPEFHREFGRLLGYGENDIDFFLKQLEDKNFNDGGPVSADENPYSILNLDPDAFVAALDELGLQGEERKFLTDQYFAQNRALPMTERPEGKTVRTILPIATPEGMTGAEALMSGDFEFTAPEFLRGMYEGPAEAINVASAIGKGVPVTESQVQEAGQVVPEMITGIGPATFAARSLARGVEMPDPSVVSMSGVGPRGMGDNGGPAMTPQRYVNPDTGLYSPSFEAAKTLKQEVGTPQQMRAMLLKAGAKEEELVYSGFDDWLKGKEKVTKQEIEDVLGRAAAGYDYGGVDPMTGFETFPGPMPYARESYTSAGITGVQGADRDSLRRQTTQQMRAEASEARDARMLAELQGRGYRPVEFANEGEFQQMADKVFGMYNTSRGGLTPEGERLPPARVYNAFNRVKGLMDRDGLPFSDPEVQRTLKSLANDYYDYLVGPSGVPEFAEDIIRRELPEESVNPYFQSLPTSAISDIEDRVDAMTQQEIADYLGVDVDEMLSNFDPGDTQYGAYVMPGLKNYSENIYQFDDAGRGVLSGIEALGVSRFQQPHFLDIKSSKAPIMFHTRTGQLETADGPAYHVAEMQSDIGQSYRKDPERFFVPGTSKSELELNKSQKAVLQDYLNRAKEAESLENDVNSKLERLYDSYLDENTGALRKDDPGYEEMAAEVRAGRKRWRELSNSLMDFESENNDLFSKIEDFYGDVQTMGRAVAIGGDFTTTRLEEILAGKAKPKKGYGLVGKSAALPFATSTNRWVDTALKNELIKAAKSNAEWFTLPRGEDVQKYTGGDPEGQAKFYEGIVPNRLKNLAKDFLPEGVEFRSLRAMGYGPKAPEYEVFGMRLTPEIKRAILEGGFPSFAGGGPVQGSSLDVDVFALR